MSDQIQTSRIKWTTIKVPVEVRDMVKKVAEYYGQAQWQILLRALSNLLDVRANPKKAKRTSLDKAAWYAFKISSSVGQFKENPSDANFAALVKTCKQIEERLGVETGAVIEAAKAFMRKRDTQSKVTLNDATKIVVRMIMEKVLSSEA